MKNVRFSTSSGKNVKLFYYLENYIQRGIPRFLFQKWLYQKLAEIEVRNDKDYLLSRLNYYNKLNQEHLLPYSAPNLSQFKNHKNLNSVYFFDAYHLIKWFSKDFKWKYEPGDITEVFDLPSLVKSRPIHGNNDNSILLKLNKLRHFIQIEDKLKFEDKLDELIFRGKVDRKLNRVQFMKQYHRATFCNLGNITKSSKLPQEWKVEKCSLYEQLRYKFILSLEGNDVASNLKWIMSSNSIAVMPKPKFETWFMEGKLIPNHHYIEIKEDYSDLEEKLDYYIENKGEACKIISNANTYAAQFYDEEREKLIGLAVMQKYFEMTGQIK